jgi:regulatory protein
MTSNPSRKKPAPPLNAERLRGLALHYTGRYATTRRKLTDYLLRKIRERGWTEGEKMPDIAALADQLSELGYVNDALYASSRARSFARRGFGARRLEQDLTAAGIEDADSQDAREHASEEILSSALALARRKKIGPFAAELAAPEKRQKQIAMMLRAGHGFDLSRRIVNAEPGAMIEED